MELKYVIINFLIMCSVIFAVGKRPVSNFLKTRHQKILADLEKAENLEIEILSIFKSSVKLLLNTEPYFSLVTAKVNEQIDEIITLLKNEQGNLLFNNGTAEVTLLCAHTLEAKLKNRVKTVCTELFKGSVDYINFTVQEDDELIGGVCLKAGNLIFDASAAAHLGEFEKHIKNYIETADDLSGLTDFLKEKALEVVPTVFVKKQF